MFITNFYHDSLVKNCKNFLRNIKSSMIVNLSIVNRFNEKISYNKNLTTCWFKNFKVRALDMERNYIDFNSFYFFRSRTKGIKAV